ncbi:hypothetical protein OAC89_05125 [Deltaproteobacteria bacterium]|nr:hypothetical protein [Deltaproteobacteria bacterium]
MVSTDTPPKSSFWREDPFSIIKQKDFNFLGINPADIPPGTFPAHRHPQLLSSRFGGNAYGFGLFEIYDHLGKEDIAILQSIPFDNPDIIKEHYETINRIYKKIGLLIRFSSRGKPYYLIPLQLLSSTLTNIKIKADEISKIIKYHRRKYLKEGHRIGILTHTADPIINDLTLRFKEHQFIIIDSPEKFSSIKEPLDLVILTRDIYRTILQEKLNRSSEETLSKKQLEKHAVYTLGKIYRVLKPDGELFIIANRQQLKTNRTATIKFKTVQEQKKFLIFTHIFKTRKKYRIKDSSLQVNTYDLEKYLGSLYVEKDVIDKLSGGKDLEEMTLEEINNLSYLNLPLDSEYDCDQQKTWPKHTSIYFNEIFLKPLIPSAVKAAWKKRFSIKDYSTDYMLIHLAQKKPIDAAVAGLKKDIAESKLAGCPLPLLANYRDSYDYLIRTLNVLKNLKSKSYKGLPEMFMERLKEPFENKRRRYHGLNDILKLMAKRNRLENIQSYLNPDMIEGPKTKVLENLEVLPFFGFSYEELREIFLIVIGHSTGGRVLSGKMSERTLKPVTDLARTYSHQEALNLLRYCRLMSMAETVASIRADMHQAHLFELFDLFDSALKIVTDRSTDWDTLLDEKISAMGGIHNKLIHRLFMMMNHFPFLDSWAELREKGEAEKESLADYDDKKLERIENIIGLVRNIEHFENKFLKDDPLQLPIIYRKLLNTEFHGTGQIFARMDSQLVFVLLWLIVNVNRGGVINFNPILSNSKYAEIDSRLKKVEEEARGINMDYLDLTTLREFSDRLYENQSAFILNTGFRLSLNQETLALDISCIDLDQDIKQLEDLAKKVTGCKFSEIALKDLEEMERLFANLEDFYQGHQRLLSPADSGFRLPKRQMIWFKRAQDLRKHLKSIFMNAIFEPEDVYTDLERLFRYSPSILHLVLPELTALQDLSLSGNIYLKAPIIDNILASTKKIQALIRGDLKELQDFQALHKLAQMEFGPMTAGIVGFNESQIDKLGSIVTGICGNRPLFDALIKAFIFQDLGLTPSLREKYKEEINIADQAQAGALFLINEKIPQKYGMDSSSEQALIFLIKHHDRILHLVRGEFSLHALKDIIDTKDKDLFNAFFVSSLIMFSALGEGLILEDLASRLFEIRDLCLRIMEGETTFEDFFNKLYAQKGRLFYALENYYNKGIPMDRTPSEYLKSWETDESYEGDYNRAGMMVHSMERIFRLRGLRYVEFIDLIKLIIEVPLRFIYQKRNYEGIGYATFEKDLFEALRIYNSIQTLSKTVQQFILEQLVADKVRIFGFENVSIYLNYENMIKLLLTALLGSQKFKNDGHPVYLSFLNMVDKIDKRYEAVNDALSNLSLDKLWGDKHQLNQLFKARTGLLLSKDTAHRVLTIDFVDKTNVSRKISHMDEITDVEQLKDYYHYSLQSLRKNSFYTDDYELELEKAFNKRLTEITNLILDQAKKRMELLNDFREIHNLYTDLLNRSLEIGFSKDQKHRLTDLYGLRKDNLRRQKLEEINGLLEKIHDINELKDYWDGIKHYLLNNRQFLGKEFENLIAKNFDKATKKIKDMSFQIHFMS